MTSRALFLALFMLLIGGCGSALAYRGAYTRVVIENQQWNDATVRLYCGAAQRATLRVSAGDRLRRSVYLGGCEGGLLVSARFLAQRGARTSGAPLWLSDDACVRITLPSNVDHIYVAAFLEPCR